jgi:hypothetical protein
MKETGPMPLAFAMKWKELLIRLAVWLFKELIEMLDGGVPEEE